MAYKFQLGAAKLGGSVEAGAISGSAITGSAVDADTADRVIAAVADTEIPIAKLAEKTISGKDLGGDLDALTSGNGISMSSYNGSAAVNDLTIQLSGTAHALKLNSDGVAVLLSGSTGLAIDGGGLKLNAVPNTSLANSGVTLTAGAGMGTLGAVALGASITVGVDGVLEDLDALTAVADGEFIVGTAGGVYAHQGGSTARDSLGLGTGDNVQFSNVTGVTGSFTGDMTISGDLTILGGVVSASVETLKIQDAQITVADGVANLAAANVANAGFEVGNDLASFTVASGSDIGFNFSSSLPLQAGTLSGDSAFIDAWEITATHISGGLPVSASAYYGDGSNLSGVSATGIQFTHGILDSANDSGTGSVANRFTVADSNAAAQLVNLPSIAPSDKGSMYIIKRLGSNNVTISSANSNQNIEGSDQDITLETDGAAVTLLAHDGGDPTHGAWLIV